MAVKTARWSSKQAKIGSPRTKFERIEPPKHMSIVANQQANGCFREKVPEPFNKINAKLSMTFKRNEDVLNED